MRILLSGQKTFGAAILNLLMGQHLITAVCAPEPGDKLFDLAVAYGLPIISKGRLCANTVPADTDLIVCAHSHEFIGEKTRLRSRLGAIGYHPSLLPLHRGRDAVRWAIKMGDRITGGTVYWLSNAVDGGPIAAQEWCFIRPGDTPSALWHRDLFPMGIRLISKVLGQIDKGIAQRIPQDETFATWEPAYDRPPLHRPDLLLLPSGEVPAHPWAEIE